MLADLAAEIGARRCDPIQGAQDIIGGRKGEREQLMLRTINAH
jgi:hypothetical protein